MSSQRMQHSKFKKNKTTNFSVTLQPFQLKIEICKIKGKILCISVELYLRNYFPEVKNKKTEKAPTEHFKA